MYYAAKLTRLYSLNFNDKSPLLQYSTLFGESLDNLIILHELQNTAADSGNILGKAFAIEQIKKLNDDVDYTTCNVIYNISPMSLLYLGKDFSCAYRAEALDFDEKKDFESALIYSWQSVINKNIKL